MDVSHGKSETGKLEENRDTGEENKESSDDAEEISQSFPVPEKIEKLDSEMQDLKIEHENLKKQHQEEREVLKKKDPDEYNEGKHLYNEVIELKGNIRVFCRCRPLNIDEVSNHALSVVEYSSCQENELQIISSDSSKKLFRFDHIFKPEDKQEDVFVQTVPIVTSVLDGFNVCIFAYGQTGTGKTFTMEGTPESRGVNYRTLEELFRVSNERGTFMKYELLVSMLEVNSEKIRDLLIENGNQPAKELHIQQSAEGTLEVPGLFEARVYRTNEVWKLLKSASRARSVGSTNANKLHSRSHCLVRVTVLGENLKNGERTRSLLWLADLAGNERVGRLDDKGERLKESQSLSALEDVISALASKTTNIPYRNSKLTHLLQSSLGGDCKMLIFVHISPNPADVGETICSLNFASGLRGVEHVPAWKQLAKNSRDREDVSSSWLAKELIVEVLLRLPVKQLIQLRRVSSLFRNLINCHDDFARSYLLFICDATPVNVVVNNGLTREYQSWKFFLNDLTGLLGNSRSCRFLFNAVRTTGPKFNLAGCCDGLLCIYRDRPSTSELEICLCNPALNQHRLLPPICINIAHTKVCLVSDSQNNDYKVIILACGRTDVSVFIYSLRLNSWRRMTNLVGDLIPHQYHMENLVVHNGKPHWISKREYKGKQEEQFVINVLDVNQEVILEIQTPENYRIDRYNFLVRYKGHLALTSALLHFPKSPIADLWIRDDESNTWVKEKIKLAIPSEVYTGKGLYRVGFCKMPWASTSWTYTISDSDESGDNVILMDVEDAKSAQPCKGKEFRPHDTSFCVADYVGSFISVQPLQEFEQHVIVMRHGERIDYVESYWDTTTSRPWDPPLTQQGKDRAFACGQKFRMHSQCLIHRILVSPFLCCLQTATELIRGLCATDPTDAITIDPSKVKVAVEYGLCEMLNTIAIKPVVTPKGHDFGFLPSQCESVLPAGTIDHSHEGVTKMPIWEESLSDARARYADVVKALADKYPSENLLLVTHGEGVGSTVAAYSDADVTEVDCCSYAHLSRSTSIDEWQSWKTGNFTVHIREGENGLSYIEVTDLPEMTV